MDNVVGFEVNEENFHAAINNAPFFARKRLLKKMTKRIYADAANTRSPVDLEQYVEMFVRHYGYEKVI